MTPVEKESRLFVARYVFARVGWVAGATLALWLVYQLRGVLVPLVVAFLLAYALDPLITRLERRKVPRAMAAVSVMAGLTAGFVSLLVLAVPYFFDEFLAAAASLSKQLNEGWHHAAPWIQEHFKVRIPKDWIAATTTFGETLSSNAPDVLRGAMSAVFGTVNVLLVMLGSLIIPVFALYLLMDFDVIIARTRVLIPRRFAPLATDIAREVDHTLGRYFRGQLTASILLSIIYSVGLSMLGLRLAIPIGVLTGFLGFVPYLGSITGFILAVLMALLDWQGPRMLVGVTGLMLGVQALDGMYLTPKIVGGSVGLKPLEVILTMMAAGTLFGFVGVFLAVPIGAVVKILVARLTSAYLQSSFYRDIPLATPTPMPGRMAHGFDVPNSIRPTLTPLPSRVTLTPVPVRSGPAIVTAPPVPIGHSTQMSASPAAAMPGPSITPLPSRVALVPNSQGPTLITQQHASSTATPLMPMHQTVRVTAVPVSVRGTPLPRKTPIETSESHSDSNGPPTTPAGPSSLVSSSPTQKDEPSRRTDPA